VVIVGISLTSYADVRGVMDKGAEASSAGRQDAYAATAAGVEKLLHLRGGPTAGHFIKTSKPHAIHFYVVS